MPIQWLIDYHYEQNIAELFRYIFKLFSSIYLFRKLQTTKLCLKMEDYPIQFTGVPCKEEERQPVETKKFGFNWQYLPGLSSDQLIEQLKERPLVVGKILILRRTARPKFLKPNRVILLSKKYFQKPSKSYLFGCQMKSKSFLISTPAQLITW